MRKWKDVLIFALILSVLVSSLTTSSFISAAGAPAKPSGVTVMINGRTVALQGYNIAGSNYFKLRSIAMAFNGTQKCFSINWDAGLNTMYLKTGESYQPIGGEFVNSPSLTAGVEAKASSALVVLNGWESVVMAYNIGGSNYFRLRDLAGVLNFSLDYSGSAKTIYIDTSAGYNSWDYSNAGGPCAAFIGSWTGFDSYGYLKTVFFSWDGTYDEGFGSTADWDYVDSGCYTINGERLAIEYSDGTFVDMGYDMFRTESGVAMALDNGHTVITLYKN